MQGAYIPQFTHMQPAAVPVEVGARASAPTDRSEGDKMHDGVVSSRKARRPKRTPPAAFPRTPSHSPSSAEVAADTGTIWICHCFALGLQLLTVFFLVSFSKTAKNYQVILTI